MKIIFRLLLFLIIFLCTPVFSQTLYVQAYGGKNIFLSPPDPISTFSPTGEVMLMYNSRNDNSSLTNFFVLFGLKYGYTTQQYKVGYNTYLARINEMLVSLGVGNEIKKGPNSLIISLCLQAGPTYANSNEPFISNSAHLGFGGQKPNIHEFLQCYLTGGIQYGIDLTNRIAILAGVKMQLYFYEEDLGNLGMKGTNVLFNYAPIKFNPFIGLQLKIGQ